MSDFKDQLRHYIDGLADPVTMQESTSPKTGPARSYPVPVAIMAGAAVVLIPAMVLVGIRLWPTGDPVADQTTIPPATTAPMPVETTTTTMPPTTATPQLFVPDIIGLSVEEARAAVEDVGLELEVVSTYPDPDRVGVLAQEPVPGAEVIAGATVLVDVAVYPECREWSASEPPVGDDEIAVTTLFECANPGVVPGDWVPVTRTQPADMPEITGTLRALLAGPTEEERLAGFGSLFSTASADALEELDIGPDGRLTVYFNDAILIGNASTSTGSTFFLAELQANLYQFPEVNSIEFRLNDSCDAFYNWLQGECQISTRTEWRRQMQAWDNERELEPASGQQLALDDVVGKMFSTQMGDAEERIFLLEDGTTTYSGFTKTEHWLLDDPAAEEETWTNWMLLVSGLNQDMIWLVDSAPRTAGEAMTFQVRAALTLPWEDISPTLRSDPFTLSGTDSCTIDGSPEPRLIVVAEILVGADDEVTGATRPLRAWVVDVGGATFEEIPTDGIECVVDFG